MWVACCLFLRIGKIMALISDFDHRTIWVCLTYWWTVKAIPCFQRSQLTYPRQIYLEKGWPYICISRSHCHLPGEMKAVTSYLEKRGFSARILFWLKNGRHLTMGKLFVEAVRAGLKKAGIRQASYCSHSFWIWPVTTAAKVGQEDLVIKTPGQWKSVAHLETIKRTKLPFDNGDR